jgi:hypothetical protein
MSVFLSSSATENPARPAAFAASKPDGPAPTIMTSYFFVMVFSLLKEF